MVTRQIGYAGKLTTLPLENCLCKVPLRLSTGKLAMVAQELWLRQNIMKPSTGTLAMPPPENWLCRSVKMVNWKGDHWKIGYASTGILATCEDEHRKIGYARAAVVNFPVLQLSIFQCCSGQFSCMNFSHRQFSSDGIANFPVLIFTSSQYSSACIANFSGHLINIPSLHFCIANFPVVA